MTTDADPPVQTETTTPHSLLRRAMVVAVCSRLVLAVVAALATWRVGVRPASWAQRLPRLAEPFHGWAAHIFNSWATWDGVWYIKIASNGYATQDSSPAFFPLYPLIVRWLSVITGHNFVIAGIVISWVCYLVAMWLLYRLVARDFGDRVAYRSVWFISIFPTAFFWQAVYSESLFLVLSLACLTWARDGRWRLAGLAGLFAALTRSAGFMLLVPMIVIYFEQRDWKLRRADSQGASLLMVIEGVMIWMAYLSLHFGKPLAFAEAQDQWKRSLALPTTAIWRGVYSTFQGLRQIVAGNKRPVYWPAPSDASALTTAYANLGNLVGFAIALAAIWYGLRRLPVAYSAYAIATIGYPLLFPSRYTPLMSMPRFALAAFPIFISMAIFTATRPRAHAAVSAFFLVSVVVLTGVFATFGWVA